MNPIRLLVEEIDTAAAWNKSVKLKRGEMLRVKGTPDPWLYYVEEGCLRVFWEGEEEEHTIRFAYRESFVTSLDSFFTGKASVFSIQAIRSTRIRVISRERFTQMRSKEKTLQEAWQKVLEALVVQQMEREIDLLTFSPHQRLQRVLERSPALFQEVPHKYIAAYLRMAPETLSRIMKAG